MFNTLVNLHKELDKQQFTLLLDIVASDVNYHKGLGTIYTEERLEEVIYVAAGVVLRTSKKVSAKEQLKRLNRKRVIKLYKNKLRKVVA